MLSSKAPGEIIIVTFDFGKLTPSVSSPTVTVTVASGTPDANPAFILQGIARVDQSRVMQRVVGGVLGTVYKLQCQVDTPGGSRYIESDLLPVKAA